ncbi:MAG: hypothetical protein JOS17DRAFT_745333 [Linnemannia elongata]|nr:MAG: hypothetical protein JOS17DRAFT_745333 [Linnemannia elongata]
MFPKLEASILHLFGSFSHCSFQYSFTACTTYLHVIFPSFHRCNRCYPCSDRLFIFLTFFLELAILVHPSPFHLEDGVAVGLLRYSLLSQFFCCCLFFVH